jgi:hypothetical protein
MVDGRGRRHVSYGRLLTARVLTLAVRHAPPAGKPSVRIVRSCQVIGVRRCVAAGLQLVLLSPCSHVAAVGEVASTLV